MTDRPILMRLERDGEIATIVLDNPEKLNAWSWESARQIAAISDELRFDDSVRVVILRAEGRAFCAGVDLGMPEDRITGRSPAEKVRNYYEKFRWVHERFKVFSNLPQPVLMAIHGYCLGAGLEIAMMGDIRIASDDAQFALPEPRVGVSIDAGGDLRLAHEIGAGWTKLLAMTGRRIDAETALRIGIVQEVVAKDDLVGHVRSLAEEIAANAPLAVQGIKRTINYRAEQGLGEAMQFEAASAAVLFTSDDMQLGYKAMARKEEAEFEGK
ncbi:MAG TPA: enoyl-CoA hydratase/isomerase family protein [Deltaproteobacteria bacterium]|nr:enoyl-CoA hydratase/isomerase family protein [Deltaproteobacteria bacterium]